MKKYILLIIIIMTILPIQAMNNNQGRSHRRVNREYMRSFTPRQSRTNARNQRQPRTSNQSLRASRSRRISQHTRARSASPPELSAEEMDISPHEAHSNESDERHSVQENENNVNVASTPRRIILINPLYGRQINENDQENEPNEDEEEELANVIRIMLEAPAVMDYINLQAQAIANGINESNDEEPENTITRDERKIELIRFIQQKYLTIQKLKDMQKPKMLERLSFIQMMTLYKTMIQERDQALEYLNVHSMDVATLQKKYKELSDEYQSLEPLQRKLEQEKNKNNNEQEVCFICCDNQSDIMQIPCPQNHTEKICTACYQKIEYSSEYDSVQNGYIDHLRCPICRTQLND